MTALSFFPWLLIDSEQQVGPFTLIPQPVPRIDDPTLPQNDILRILKAYHLHAECRIHGATLIKLHNKNVTDVPEPAEAESLFTLSNILAIAYLSQRDYFGHGEYSNAEAFQCIVQRFTAGKGGVAIETRRRDGSSTSYSPEKYFKVIKAHHIASPHRLNTNDPFIHSLWNLSQHEEWPRFNEAIFSFLRGNTDSSEIPLHGELIFLCGAIERVLGVENGKTDEVAENFTTSLAIIKEDSEIPISERISSRTKMPKVTSIRELWIRDFHISRGDLAHGRKKQKYRSIWTLGEHLLLATEIFPILLKIEMQKLGVYKLNESDLRTIHYFDHRIRSQNLYSDSTDPEDQAFGWKTAIENAVWSWPVRSKELMK